MTTRTRKTTLMGATEVAIFLGVSRQRVLELRQKHHDFPEPLEQLAAGPVWDKAEIEHFLANWDRTPGRPRKRPIPASTSQTQDDQQAATLPSQEEVAVSNPDPVAEDETHPEHQPEPTLTEEQPETTHEPEVEIPEQPRPEKEYPVADPVDPSEETLHSDNR